MQEDLPVVITGFEEEERDDAVTETITDETVEEEQAPTASLEDAPQKDIDRAIALRLEDARRKERIRLESDPVYQLGKMYAEQHGGDAAKAQEDLINKRAEEYSADPKKLAEYVLRASQPQVDPFQKVIDELTGMVVGGELPRDFNPTAYADADPEFVENCTVYGARAAIKMAERSMSKEEQIAKKLARNQQLPQSTRPASNVVPQAPNYVDMTSSEYMEARRKLRRGY